MEEMENGILIKYRTFTDKDLRYVIYLIQSYFNGEIMDMLHWGDRYPHLIKKERYSPSLHMPLEITEISSEKSIEINLTINIPIIVEYLEINFPEISGEATSLIEEHGREILSTIIGYVVAHFRRRRRKDRIDSIEKSEKNK